ncbi:hypothetical protein P691DRAFT_778579 [Macrolepiota fuliginosa MF-IS2]|uniref:Uncharacterized protein n=1 Tax=Macrolepiota fuliginosa MF-IS2 TaxID=1400762 RepID=A0A9P6C016_9AGAR|nr:hypothetical protein P691DRAFT_778579 [Macrolepiota fuliginosa MF-IS2]
MLGTKSRQVAREVLQASPAANLSQDDLEKSMEALRQTCDQVQQWSKKCIVLQWFARNEIQRECERRQQDLDSAIRLLQDLAIRNVSWPEENNIEVKNHVNAANQVKTEAPTAADVTSGLSDAQPVIIPARFHAVSAFILPIYTLKILLQPFLDSLIVSFQQWIMLSWIFSHPS